jgi:hypothetical protein
MQTPSLITRLPGGRGMTGLIGAVLFVAGTGALACWLVARRPWCPSSLKGVIAHALLALVALQASSLLVRPESPNWWRFTGLLTVIAPALLYTWLSAAWTALFVKAARNNALR